MKKVLSVVALVLCCLLMLSACDYTPYLYYKRRALAIETECKDYSLMPTRELLGTELSREITDDDYVERDFLINPANDDADEIEFYNDNGLYIYMLRRVLHVYCNGALYDLTPKYFRDKSKVYNQIEQIWANKYGIEQNDVPNYIVGAIVFDGDVLILAQNDPAQLIFDREHQLNLWKFDPDDGSIAFCGFCVSHDERGRAEHILSPSGNAISIVKNVG